MVYPQGVALEMADDPNARSKGQVPDVIAEGLAVLFCGINPGRSSGASGHHFAGPGNRFWKVLAGSGFTPTVFEPGMDSELLSLGIGITNLVSRVTATAAELSREEPVSYTHLTLPTKRIV